MYIKVVHVKKLLLKSLKHYCFLLSLTKKINQKNQIDRKVLVLVNSSEVFIVN
jgi:hypothetical protein